MAEKRKRSPNWLSSEKYLLLDIVQKHFNVIENKKTDAVTMKQKTAEWITMSDEYNSQTIHSHRTAENLKAQWESMKKAVKKEASNIRMHLIQTGGGPPKPKTEDAFYKRILGLIEPSVVGLYNPFDDDARDLGFDSHNTVSQSIEVQDTQSLELAHVKVIEAGPPVPDCIPVSVLVKEPDGCKVKIIEVGSPVADSAPVPVAVKKPDWANYTPRLLQTPTSRNIRLDAKDTNSTEKKKGISKRRPVLPASSLELLHNTKVEAIVAQREHAHDERQEGNSLYKISMQIKEEELKIKREELKQNKIKTRLLLLELRIKKKNIEKLSSRLN